MKLEYRTIPADAGLNIARHQCTNCLSHVDAVAELEIAYLPSFRLCDYCRAELRKLLGGRRTRRPISPRGRRVLAWLAQTPAGCGSLEEIGAATGGYAMNVVKSLLERRLVEHRRPTDPFVYCLTAAGREELAS